MKENKKALRKIGLFYGFIIIIINILGYMVAASGNMPIKDNADFEAWVRYLNENSFIPILFTVLSFAVPTALSVCYSVFCNENNVIKRLINIPIVFSLYGSVGWIISLISESIVLIYLNINGILNMQSILLSNFLNIFQMSTFITTFAFLVLDLIHRKFVLGKLFPEGQLSKKPGVIHLSSNVLFMIFYFSVGIFPIGFLISTIYNLSLSNGFAIKSGVIIVIILIIILGICMTFFFSDHFSSPSKKLKEATMEMTNSNYNVKVDVVSCDDFGDLADNFNEMAMTLDEKSKKILAIQDSIIRGMAVMVEQRDNSTGGHINRTSDCVRIFMNHLGTNSKYSFTPSFCAAVIKAAPMHDLGKIAVDDKVLRKPGRFTDEEYEIMKGHAAAGQVIVDRVLSEVDDEEFKKVTRNVAHYHHEKWNGTGYPNGIKGEDIPVEARIMALADVFDALVSKRCYKEAMSYDKAFEIIRKDLGTHFDPELGELFLHCKDELVELYESYSLED